MTLLAALLVAAVGPADGAALVARSADMQRRVERELPADVLRAVVVHAFGECQVVVVAEGERPRARLDVSASGADEPLLRRFLERIDLSVAREAAADGSEGKVAAIRSLFPPKDEKPAELSFAASLTLWLPEAVALELTCSYGRVHVEGRGADVKVVNQFGAVELQRVRGDVEVDDQYGAISVADVSGGALLKGKSSAVTALRVGGHVEVRTNGAPVRIEGAGSVRVENHLKSVELHDVAGDAAIVAPFCAVTARWIGGSLTIESGNASIVVEEVGQRLSIQHKNGKIDARGVKGDAIVLGNLSDVALADVGGSAEVRSAAAPVKVSGVGGRLIAENSARTLEIVNARGDVEASARGGLLRMKWTRLPADGAEHAVTLEGEAGGIELELPDAASVALDLTSSGGSIDCALPGMNFEQNGAARSGTLALGGGKVKLHATCVGGAIRVRRAAAR